MSKSAQKTVKRRRKAQSTEKPEIEVQSQVQVEQPEDEAPENSATQQSKKKSLHHYPEIQFPEMDEDVEIYSEPLWLTGKRPAKNFSALRGKIWYPSPKRLCIEISSRPTGLNSKQRKARTVTKSFEFLVDPVELSATLLLALNQKRGFHKIFMGRDAQQIRERWILYPAWSIKTVNKRSMVWQKLKKSIEKLPEIDDPKTAHTILGNINKNLLPKIEKRLSINSGINLAFKQLHDDPDVETPVHNLFIQGITFYRVIDWFRRVIESYDDTRLIGSLVIVRKDGKVGLAGSNSPILRLSHSQRDQLRLALERLLNSGAIFGFRDGDLSFGKLKQSSELFDAQGVSIYVRGRRVPIGSVVNAAEILMCL